MYSFHIRMISGVSLGRTGEGTPRGPREILMTGAGRHQTFADSAGRTRIHLGVRVLRAGWLSVASGIGSQGFWFEAGSRRMLINTTCLTATLETPMLVRVTTRAV